MWNPKGAQYIFHIPLVEIVSMTIKRWSLERSKQEAVAVAQQLGLPWQLPAHLAGQKGCWQCVVVVDISEMFNLHGILHPRLHEGLWVPKAVLGLTMYQQCWGF